MISELINNASRIILRGFVARNVLYLASENVKNLVKVFGI